MIPRRLRAAFAACLVVVVLTAAAWVTVAHGTPWNLAEKGWNSVPGRAEGDRRSFRQALRRLLERTHRALGACRGTTSRRIRCRARRGLVRAAVATSGGRARGHGSRRPQPLHGDARRARRRRARAARVRPPGAAGRRGQGATSRRSLAGATARIRRVRRACGGGLGLGAGRRDARRSTHRLRTRRCRSTRGSVPRKLPGFIGVAAPIAAAALASLALWSLLSTVPSGRARAALERGDYQEAASEARDAERWAPWSSRPWRLLGEAQLYQGNVPAARRSFRRAVEHGPGEWLPWLELAITSTGAEERRALERAAALNPNEEQIREPAEVAVRNRPREPVSVRRPATRRSSGRCRCSDGPTSGRGGSSKQLLRINRPEPRSEFLETMVTRVATQETPARRRGSGCVSASRPGSRSPSSCVRLVGCSRSGK